MKRGLLALVISAFLGCRSQAPSSAPESSQPSQSVLQVAGGAFDYYLLNLSWSPEFCFSHSSAPECAAHDAFVLHGLWPENNDGTYPENCSNAPGPADPTQYNDLYPDPGLLEHEWQAHGTCSGLSADAFFQTARAAYRSVTIPPTLADLKAQTSMPPGEILGLFTDSDPRIPRSSLALSCGHNYLTAVEVCLDKSLHPTPCAGVRSCRASLVRILAP
jgi:ribonuclease T2